MVPLFFFTSYMQNQVPKNILAEIPGFCTHGDNTFSLSKTVSASDNSFTDSLNKAVKAKNDK